jgi:Zn-dependent M28 family amino/carboxypeptidase
MNRTAFAPIAALLACTIPLQPARAQAPLPVRPRADAPAPVDPAVAALRTRALHDDLALDIVTGLTTEVGPRPDGSDAEGRARDWAVARLQALGFAHVHVEPFTLPAWQRGAESAAVVAPFHQPLRIAGLGNSGATPPGGLTLPLVVFASYNDLLLAPTGSLTGKIAFVSNAMQPTQDGSSYGSEGTARFMGPSEAAKRGAAAIVLRSIGTDHSRAPHTGATDFAPGVAPIPAAALSVADAENLERMVALAQKSGTPIMLHLELDDHAVGQRQSGNVIAEVPGTDPAAGVIVIGGHLDSWDLGTGAIDDGAGVAITTAAARLLMQSGPHRRTIRVIWFGDEETGGFGGMAYAKAHGTEPHALVAESDLGADRVWRFGTAFPDSARTVIPRLTAALGPLGVVHGTTLVDVGTDVEPMAALGTSGIDLNQSALHYFDVHHTAEDTLDQIDPAQLRQNVATWTTMLAILADAPESLLAVKR